MNSDVKELLFVCIELICTLNVLAKLEDGKGVDYSDVLTDLKWNLNVLNNRVTDLK